MSSDDDLVHGFIADLEKRYGKRPIKPPTFEFQEVPNALHADWNDVRNHVTIRLPNWGEVHRKGQLAHESFHVFSPVKPSEATYLDEGLATLNAKQCQNYMPHPDSAKYHEALSLVEHLIDTCPDSIRKLLSLRGRIALVSPSDIVAVCKKFPLSDANLLVRKFYP
jgi:hypothetical protein